MYYIILTIIIVFIYYNINKNNIISKSNKKKKNNNYKENFNNKIKKKYNKNINDQKLQDIINNINIDTYYHQENTNDNLLKKNKLNDNFINIQFHNDYRDVITAINNLIVDEKVLFNLANRPLQYSEPPIDEVIDLVHNFVSIMNTNIHSIVPNERKINSGWDEAIPDPNIKSGWAKMRKSLNLPESLYDDPSHKSFLNLIDIQKIQKYETEDEIKYKIKMILQKQNVDDQIVITATFLLDKKIIKKEELFFKKNKNIDLNVIIEHIFVDGYLSNDGEDMKKQFDGQDKKWYDYNNLEKNNLTDPKYVQKVLLEQYNKRSFEMEKRNSLLDEEGQDFHNSLPKVYDYQNIKATQTIFDDMNNKKNFV